jgi:hypothetical protein
MAPPLSPETERRVSALFDTEFRAEASKLLIEQCGNNLPFCRSDDEFKLERIRFAALKCSAGDIAKLKRAVELAKQDWRDLLVEAGFAHDPHIHERRFPDDASD